MPEDQEEPEPSGEMAMGPSSQEDDGNSVSETGAQ